ncbi:MraY family glycosyltransferase [Pelodictyon luteolum]|uniref:Putative glycosyl transferase, family 4 n=1 Tax=Chlorobium luteolum (strain DSM 273 / BCRC 81028 / 2530) TaxID=319225 RepID=Q3B1P7_CHLL3|nr:glycosyltransferase [Pelodictyon luteolum]ABB24734.1 putative glycosyl transferase, family 4 [Pelodictyon luteolum DSM 273]
MHNVAEVADVFHASMIYPPIISAGVSGALVLSKSWHGKHSFDSHDGIQKFHDEPTPRIGGVALYLALFVAWMLLPDAAGRLLGQMLLASVPAFAAGLTEDFTKRVGVGERLLATMLSGLLAAMLTGYAITRSDIAALDRIVALMPVSLAVTAFAVGGVANAVNIIDGFNGLAGGVLMICFTALGLIALSTGDLVLVQLCFLLTLSVGGFMMLNFPFGKIFMGDGGAYFMGFMLAWVALMLPMRNPAVSPWASVVVCSYPLIETLFSILRRLINRTGPGAADSQHLHSLIKLKIIRRYFSRFPRRLRNAMVSPVSWVLTAMFAAPALWFSTKAAALQFILALSVAAFALLHALLYRMAAVEQE